MIIDEFLRQAEAGFNRIPLSRVIAADLETPLSIYLKASLHEQRGTFLFESMQGGEQWGRYSIVGMPCSKRIEVWGNTIKQLCDDQVTDSVEVADPLHWIENYMAKVKVPEVPDLPRITGGLVGYFSYDTIQHIEKKISTDSLDDPIGTPDMLFLVCDELCVFDNLRGTATLIALVDLADATDPERAFHEAEARLQDMHARMLAPLVIPMQSEVSTQTADAIEDAFASGFTEEAYKKAVQDVKDYIVAGDCMQVVLSQRLSTSFTLAPVNLYRALRRLNPSPYLFFIDAGDHQIVGSSPEILVRLENNEVTVRPIAGTRPRGQTEAQDKALEQELLADPKELAEHLMLIDLGRNDVGRVARTGTVEVTDQMAIERYSHVMHIVSNVIGQLKPNLSNLDVLRATFPAGTLSGAPKVRAMEIIQELEPVKRGIYGGAIGYLSWNGNMDTCIAIRTAVIKDETLHIQAGAGIVYDSDPQSEWDETIAKARAIVRAVVDVEHGFDASVQQAPHHQAASASSDSSAAGNALGNAVGKGVGQ